MDPETVCFFASFCLYFWMFFCSVLFFEFLWFWGNVCFVLVFTKDSAYRDFVGTRFFCVVPPNSASEFSLKIWTEFKQKSSRNWWKVCSEAEFVFGPYFLAILTHFCRFLANSGGFWGPMGGPGAAFLRFLAYKKLIKIWEGFWKDFCELPGWGGDYRGACSEAF